MSFRRTLRNVDLPKGMYRSSSGHIRYSSPLKLRGEYVHRKKVADMLAETPFSIQQLIPWPYEVHHADYNKENNCCCNFILMDESFHAALTAHNSRRDFQPKWRPAPQWKLFNDDSDVVPF